MGERIREALNNKNMMIKDLANSIGASREAVAKWISNKNYPNSFYIKSMCEVLGVSADWLLDVCGGVNNERFE